MTIVPIYAAVLTFLFIGLSVRVIRLRGQVRAAIGTRQDPQLERAIRVHGNFAEYVPLALLLLAMVEGQGAPHWLLHALGLLLLLGRLSHAWGVSQVQENFRFRIFGMMASFSVLALSALTLLWYAMR